MKTLKHFIALSNLIKSKKEIAYKAKLTEREERLEKEKALYPEVYALTDEEFFFLEIADM